jgi:protein-disulfide isomerase-like protein with CxxC motif
VADDIRDEARDEIDLTDEEIQQETGEELPDREAMSLLNLNVAAPVNAAVAANVLSDNSVAYANAEQSATIIQGT